MKTVLSLISEFGALNDAMMRTGGNLAPEDEKRWRELKAFYQVLMSQTGLEIDREVPLITADDIRDNLTDRERIRVPVEVPVVFEHDGAYLGGRVVNLSRGGLFIASETLLKVESQVTVYLSQIGPSSEGLLEIRGVVAWVTERGAPEIALPRGMGVQFTEYPSNVEGKLDSFVVETIAKKLSSLW